MYDMKSVLAAEAASAALRASRSMCAVVRNRMLRRNNVRRARIEPANSRHSKKNKSAETIRRQTRKISELGQTEEHPYSLLLCLVVTKNLCNPLLECTTPIER